MTFPCEGYAASHVTGPLQSVADDTDIAPISDQLFGSDLAGSFKKVTELAVDRQTARKMDRGRSFCFGDSGHYSLF